MNGKSCIFTREKNIWKQVKHLFSKFLNWQNCMYVVTLKNNLKIQIRTQFSYQWKKVKMKLSQKAKYYLIIHIQYFEISIWKNLYPKKSSASKQGKQASNFIILKFLTKTTLVTYFVVNGVKELIVKAKEFTR